MPGQRISRIYAPVLTARAAKTDCQTFKSAFYIISHRNIHQIINTVEIFRHKSLLFQVIFYRLVPAGLLLEFSYPARIQDTPAIKDESAAVAAFICRYSFLIGE